MATIRQLILELESRRKYNKIDFLYPDKGADNLSDPHSSWSRHLYTKHLEFFKAGAKYKQRLFSAGNRTGKTMSMCYELTCHLTGNYPDWWEGHRFSGPNPWMVVGQTNMTTTQILQTELLGVQGDFGSGMIPKHLIDFTTLPAASKMGVGVSGFRVKHVSGGWSNVYFRSQEQGLLSMVGLVANIWCDEPLKLSLYTELLTRTATINGLFICTATPVLGFDEFLREYCNGTWQTGEINQFKWVGSQTWSETPHLSEVTCEMLLSSYPPYQRDCRSKGIPMLGSGAVYPVAESAITVSPFEIPEHWPRVVGLDVGWQSTAAVWLAHDRDSQTWYLYSEYKMGELIPAMHAQNIIIRGDYPIAIDTASHGRSQNDGEVIFDQLQEHGLDLHNANKAVEAGLFAVLELLAMGRLKIFTTCREILKDILSMERDENGKIKNKSKYHLADAMRYAVMTRDIARTSIKKYDSNSWTSGPRAW